MTYTTSQYKHNALGFLRMTVTKNIVTPTLTLYTAPIISNIFNNLPEAMKQQADTVFRFGSRMFLSLHAREGEGSNSIFLVNSIFQKKGKLDIFGKLNIYRVYPKYRVYPS